MIKKIKKFINNREVFYPNIEIFSYFLLKAFKKTFTNLGLIKTEKNDKDMFDWPLYYLHYRGELKKDAKTSTISLKPNDYILKNDSLIKNNKLIKPLHPNHRLLYETIMHLNPKSIYEMGCGTGMHLHNLSVLMPKARICGTDLADMQLKYLKKTYPELSGKVKQKDSTILTKETPFEPCDVAFSQAVLMHIHTGESHLNALENMFAMSKKYVVFIERWKNHNYKEDIEKLFKEKRIKWDKLFMYYRKSEGTYIMICSNTPLKYQVLDNADILPKN